MVEFVGQLACGFGRVAIMNQHAGAGAVQRAHDFSADAPCAAGNQRHAVLQGVGFDTGCHAGERYRIVRAGGNHGA
jgi:hypothetical protein